MLHYKIQQELLSTTGINRNVGPLTSSRLRTQRKPNIALMLDNRTPLCILIWYRVRIIVTPYQIGVVPHYIR